MSKHRTVTALTFCAATLSVAALDRVQAQDAPKPAGGYASLEDLRADYGKKLVDLDRHRIADLTALTTKVGKEEAEEVYRELFNIAVGRELFSEAEKAAQQYLASDPADPRDRSMATLVALIAKANRGEYDQSLADLQAAFRNRKIPADPAQESTRARPLRSARPTSSASCGAAGTTSPRRSATWQSRSCPTRR